MNVTKFEHHSCDLCRQNASKLLFKAKDCIGKGDEFSVVECESCGLVRINPRPQKKFIFDYYPEEDYYAYQPEKRHETIFKNVRTKIMEFAGGYEKESMSFPFVTNVARRIAERMALGLIPALEGGRLLDVGCGNGAFLEWYSKHGWRVYGVEPSERAYSICRQKGLEVFHGELDQAGYPPDYFDVVSLVHVLEHTTRPLAVLTEVRRVLKPNGLVLVGVPNFGCYDRKLLSESWWPLEAPRHIYHFDVKTLCTMLRRSGFRIKSVKGKSIFSYNHKYLKLFLSNRSSGISIYDLLKLFMVKPVKYLLDSRKIANFCNLVAVQATKIDLAEDGDTA